MDDLTQLRNKLADRDLQIEDVDAVTNVDPVTPGDLKTCTIVSAAFIALGIIISANVQIRWLALLGLGLVIFGLYWQFFFIDLYIKEFRDKDVQLESNGLSSLH